MRQSKSISLQCYPGVCPALIWSLAAFGCLALLLRIPVDPVTGYSLARLSMAGVLLVTGVFAMFLAWRLAVRDSYWLARAVALRTMGERKFLVGALATLAGLLFLVAVTRWVFPLAYQAVLERLFPLLVFGCVTLCLLLWQAQRSPGVERMLAMIAGVVLLAVYLILSHHYATLNREYWLSDQNAYMDFARAIRASDFRYTGERNYMPVYPGLQALFITDPEITDEALYRQGKTINILLSLALLLGIVLLVRPALGRHAWLFGALAMFTLYIYKSAYFQPELLFYGLFFAAFLLMLHLLNDSPDWRAAAALGLILAAAQLTKASMLPAIGWFAAVFGLQGFLLMLKRWRNGGAWLPILANRVGTIAALVLVFGVIFAPYALESKARYGSYFYNVNSSFYLWYDSWGEVKLANERRLVAGEAEPVPTLQTYMQTHSANEIMARLGRGLASQWDNLANPFSAASYFLLYFVTGCLVLLRKRASWGRWLREAGFSTLFVVGLFAGYLLVFAWYAPIADFADNRFTYTLYLPGLYVFFRVLGAAAPEAGLPAKFRPETLHAGFALLLLELLFHLPTALAVFHWYGK